MPVSVIPPDPGSDNSEIVFSISNSGSVLTTGVKVDGLEIPCNCTIQSVVLTADQSGSVQLDILKSTYSNFPTMSSIVAAAPPALSSAQKSKDTTLTGWTKDLLEGDLLRITISSVSTITRLTMSIKVLKT